MAVGWGGVGWEVEGSSVRRLRKRRKRKYIDVVELCVPVLSIFTRKQLIYGSHFLPFLYLFGDALFGFRGI